MRQFRSFIIMIGVLWVTGLSPLFAVESGSNEIRVQNYTFGRFSIYFQHPQHIEPYEATLLEKIGKNLRLSGFYDITKNHQKADLTLSLKQLPGETSQVSIQSGSDTFYTETIHHSQGLDPVIRTLIFQLTGQESLLGNAIVYAEKGKGEGYRLKLTDPLNQIRKTLLNDGNLNILPKWNPNGREILFTALERKKSYLKILEVESLSTTHFNKNPRFNYSSGAWVPNSQNLVMTLSRKGNSDIYWLTGKGQIIKQLTQRSSLESNPRISPDGTRLLFVSNRSGSIHIYQKILSSGKEIRMTYEGRLNVEPSWSADGEFIVFASMKKKRYQIFVMDKRGDHIQQLTHGATSSEQPIWSPNGRQILFASKVQRDYKLFLMDVDGKNKKRLTKSGRGIGEFNASWTSNFNWDSIAF